MGGTIASPQADATWRGVLCLREMALAVWGMTLHKDPAGCFSVLSPEPPTPDSTQVSLAHSVPLPESRVRVCKKNFVLWPFQRLSVSPAVSPWLTGTLLLSRAGCYLDFFPALAL